MDAISIGAILQFLSGNLFKSLQNISHVPTFFPQTANIRLKEIVEEEGRGFIF